MFLASAVALTHHIEIDSVKLHSNPCIYLGLWPIVSASAHSRHSFALLLVASLLPQSSGVHTETLWRGYGSRAVPQSLTLSGSVSYGTTVIQCQRKSQSARYTLPTSGQINVTTVPESP